MSFTDPTVAQFKQFFSRDFTFGSTNETVKFSDITKAMDQAKLKINTALFGSQAEYTNAFLLLSAHNLVTNLKASTDGVGGEYTWLVASSSVGSVSESSSIPQDVLANPMYSFLSKTHYGTQYLMCIWPLLRGQIFCVGGATQA